MKHRAQILALYQSGLSMRQIAIRLKMAKRTVQQIVQGAGLSRPPGGPKKTDLNTKAFEEHVRREYLAGKSCKSIARLVGRSKAGVHSILKRLRQPRRKFRYLGKCVECGKDSGLNQRCPLHRRVRGADMDRWRMRRVKGIPKNRWRVQD